MAELKKYEIKYLKDFAKVPPDRLMGCLADFGRTVELKRHEILTEPQKIGQAKSLVFVWVDDGKDEPAIFLEKVPDKIDVELSEPSPETKVIELFLPGVKLVQLPVSFDSLGFEIRTHDESESLKLGLPDRFSRIEHVFSAPGVLSGIHHRLDSGSVIRCVRGRVWCVAVNLRPDSIYYKAHYGVELNEYNGRMYLVPGGYGYGYSVLGEEPASVVYSVYGQGGGDRTGVAWDDPSLAIPWPVAGQPQVSDADLSYPPLEKFRETS